MYASTVSVQGATIIPCDSADVPTTACWMHPHVLCVGYASGTLRCFDEHGVCIWSELLHDTEVLSIKKSRVHDAHAHVVGGAAPAASDAVWVLYRGGMVISVRDTCMQCICLLVCLC